MSRECGCSRVFYWYDMLWESIMHISLIKVKCLKCDKKISAANKTKCCKACYPKIGYFVTHRLTYEPVYIKYMAMRAAHKNNDIAMDPAWYSIQAFIKDMGLPNPGDILRRKHKNRGFNKDNCAWQTVTIRDKIETTLEDDEFVVLRREYAPWLAMVHRCIQQKKQIDPTWRYSFKNFLEDMGARQKGDKLVRIDKNKGYTKDNCRWAKTAYRK